MAEYWKSTQRYLATLTGLASLALPQLARAEHAKPIPHAVRAVPPTHPKGPAPAGSPWTPLTNPPKFLVNGASNPILLTDGSVLVQDTGFPDWWKLTPDEHGSYVNGTWTQVASLPPTYSPLYHSSAVLADGRLIIEGGEYLLNADQTALIPTWTPQGSIYDPTLDVWTPVAPPPFFTGFDPGTQTIGDAQGVVLANGTYMQANCCKREAALLDSTTLTWTPTGAGKFDEYDEEGWTLLPSGKLLTTDAYGDAYDPTGTNSEIYDPATGAWTSAGSTLVQLWDSAAECGGRDARSAEVGPSVLRPDGTVFFVGGNSCGAGHTAIFDSATGKWTAGPDLPDALDSADAPAALEPNGKVLVMASPGIFNAPSAFFEWDGEALVEVPGPPNAPVDSSFEGNMLVLPTGQILFADFSNDIEIYTPAAAEHTTLTSIQPIVTAIGGDIVVSEPKIDGDEASVISRVTLLTKGNTYPIAGIRFNGVSQGAAYGDDIQAATNYPLVRITNTQTGHVFYGRTHDHSSMAVASQNPVATFFDVSKLQEPGPSILEVVANGIASRPVKVLIKNP